MNEGMKNNHCFPKTVLKVYIKDKIRS